MRLLPAPPSAAVDGRTAVELVDAARSLAASLCAPGVGGPERLARATRAADSARDLADVLALADPYADRRYARVLDLAALNERRHNGDRDAAVERLARDRQYRSLIAETRAVAWVDAAGLKSGVPVPVPAPTVPGPSVTPFLDRYGVEPVEPLGPGRWLGGSWTNIPNAVIDPAPGDEIGGGTSATLPGGLVDWHTSAYAVDVSDQLEDWTVGGAREVEYLLQTVVSLGLETVILADLTTGAPTAADVPAAMAACRWPTGADVVLVAGSDVPAVNAAFGAAGQWPPPVAVLASDGVPAGTAVVLASAGVIVEASPVEWLTAVKPSLLGQDIAALRYGLGRARQVGAVVTVPVIAGP